MVRFAICDDEASYLNYMANIFKESYKRCSDGKDEVECILYESGDELLENYINDKIDVVFMDIECGDRLGFDIAKELVKITKNPGIVYMTNYTSYITQAFVCRPLGFISKKNISSDIDYTMANVAEYLEEIKRVIIFHDGTKELVVNVNKIKAVNVFNHRLDISLTDRNINIAGQLSDCEKALLDYGFIKISRGTIINAKYITSIVRCDVYMEEDKYRISRDRVKDVYAAWSLADMV